MENLQTKRVNQDEIEQLRNISIETFTETFSPVNSVENMSVYLASNLSVQKLTDELGTAGSEFYFAMLNDDIIGYLKINTGSAQTELNDTDCLEIERIYVLKAYHGKKVGQFLFETAVQIAREKQVEFIWLGVWEENQKALSFYRKNGFLEFDKHRFMLGSDEQTDIMMKMPLR